jgi:hypothetical protein
MPEVLVGGILLLALAAAGQADASADAEFAKEQQ